MNTNRWNECKRREINERRPSTATEADAAFDEPDTTFERWKARKKS